MIFKNNCYFLTVCYILGFDLFLEHVKALTGILNKAMFHNLLLTWGQMCFYKDVLYTDFWGMVY